MGSMITLQELGRRKRIIDRMNNGELPLFIGNWDENNDKISEHHINTKRKDRRPENIVKIPRWFHDMITKQHKYIKGILALSKKCFIKWINEKAITFNITWGYDYDRWKVTMIKCSNNNHHRRMIASLPNDHKWKGKWTYTDEELL